MRVPTANQKLLDIVNMFSTTSFSVLHGWGLYLSADGGKDWSLGHLQYFNSLNCRSGTGTGHIRAIFQQSSMSIGKRKRKYPNI